MTAPTPPPAHDQQADAAGGAHQETTVEVDARGLACPMPVIELSRAIEPLAPGAHVRLLATDPAAKVDVPVWCRMQRQQLVSAVEDAGVWTFVVEKLR